MAKRLEVPESWVKQAIEVASPGGQRTATSPKNEITSSNPSVSLVETVSQASSGAMKKVSLRGASPVELQLTRLALKSRANFSFVLSENSFSLITHPVLRRVLERAREVYGQDVEKFDKLPSLLINFLEEPEFLFEGGISSGGVSKWSHSKIESPKISELQFAEPGEFEKRSSQDDKQSDLMQFSSRLVSEEIGDAEVQLIKDVIKKLKENDLKTQLRNLKEQLRTSPSEESLQKLQDIQKQINQLKHGV
jgi:DNA primase